jgi:Bacterial pre-peptidase C-terminal domain/Fibronectin type III domain
MKTRSVLVRSAAVLGVLLVPFVAGAQQLTGISNASLEAFAQPFHDHGAYVVREVDGRTSCQDASPYEASMINVRPGVPMRVFGESADKVRANASAGLNIVLRGTAQLDANPQAKAAFERAAEIWESRIANPVTVYVDVDFGSTRFGQAWPDENIIASASSDYRGGTDGLYAGLRPLLVARADNATETAVYGALPATSMPTDLGTTTRLASPSILLRALGALPATAQQSDSGPSIGFNSAFLYDFDPSNGIAPGAKDFEGVVVHEIGHMLGFTSLVGVSENGTGAPFTPTILDFFRFRPGVNSGSFTSSQRVLSSGGDHVYFANGSALNLSTGRPDGTGGDEQQASHWKDDALTGQRIGIMDPTLGSGTRTELTNNDLLAFGMIGYNIVAPAAGCSEVEPNETTAGATALTLGTPCSGNAASNDASAISITFDDGSSDKVEDVFKVTLPSSAKLNVSLTFSAGDLDIYAFNAAGDIVGSSYGSSNTETFTTTNTLAAGTYYIGVSAFSGSSSYTLTANAEGQVPQVPGAPTNLTATAISSSAIRLNWTDNASNETGFSVEQRVNGVFIQVPGTVAANATSVEITGLSANQTATFRIRALGAAGNSDYSNEATATTFGSGPTTCTPSSTTVCLLDGRFRVSIAFINQFANPPAPGNFLGAKLVAGSQNPDVATFGISSAQAIEVVVRIQDTRPFGLNRFDVYYGGLTDLEYTVSITDVQKGTTKTYRNPPGTVGGGVDRTTFTAN